eukprot:3745731-Rhodomonas_salina.1
MHPLCHGLRKDTPSPGTIQARRMRKQSGSEHPQHIRHAMHGTNKGYAGITLVQEGPEGYTPTVHDIGKRLRVAPPSRNVLSLASAMLTYGVSRPGRRDSGPCNSRTKIKTCPQGVPGSKCWVPTVSVSPMQVYGRLASITVASLLPFLLQVALCLSAVLLLLVATMPFMEPTLTFGVIGAGTVQAPPDLSVFNERLQHLVERSEANRP